MPRIADTHVNTPEYWDGVYSRGEYPTLEENNVTRYEAVARLQKGDTALDIGCGQGGLGKVLLELYQHLFYRGIDYSSDALTTHVDLPNIPRRWLFYCSPWQYIAQAADTAYLCEIVEHVDDPLALIKHAAGLAQQRLVVSVPQYNVLTYAQHRGEHMWDFTGKELLDMLRPYGTVGPLRVANCMCWAVAVDRC